MVKNRHTKRIGIGFDRWDWFFFSTFTIFVLGSLGVGLYSHIQLCRTALKTNARHTLNSRVCKIVNGPGRVGISPGKHRGAATQ